MPKRSSALLPEPLAWLAGLLGALAAALPLAMAENGRSWADLLLPPPAPAISLSRAAPPPDWTPPWTEPPAPATPEAEEAALLFLEASLLDDLKSRARPQPAFSSAAVKYEDLIKAAARQHRVSPHLIRAVIQAESNFNPAAVSHNGAVGLMQIMPATAKSMGIKNLLDPGMNIEAGARYLKTMLKLFNDDERLALAAYNCGPEAMRRFNNAIPPFPETRNYVDRVMRYYSQNLDG